MKIFIFLFISCLINAQNSVENFLKPSDSINQKREKIVYIAGGSSVALGLVGLHELWYKDYPKSSFHTLDDSNDWQQMDKLGHFFSAYHLSRVGAELVNWTGASTKNQLIYGASAGFLFLTTVEIMDGHAQDWGFSWSDMAANTLGTSLFITQDLLWKEQKIIPKFSYHHTNYAPLRPSILGSSTSERIFKDYNGQTYWLSVNLHSFFKDSNLPKWLNFAIGYGAEGMLAANNETVINQDLPQYQRIRNFYASIDVDLTKIKTNSHLLKTIFSAVNVLKIPAPTFQINQKGQVTWHGIYF